MFEVVYGGARGGGKTDASLGDFALHASAYGRLAKGLFVRRTRVALEPTIARAKEIYLPLGAKWREQRSCFEWPTGARLYFRYLDRDADADAYQGHDYTRVYVEELKALDVRVARIEARLETLIEQLRDLNAALRWMRPMPDRGAEV
ncbi:MAG: terminase family protein [Proteobacteria bacterium]|nr:terminase family protein [Pseudomonadota bacterium]